MADATPAAAPDAGALAAFVRGSEAAGTAESAAALLARVHVAPLKTGLPFVDAVCALRPGHVLELVGPAGSGKTEALLQVAVSVVLPRELGGEAGAALVLDLDGKFDALRLVEVLLLRIRAGRLPQQQAEQQYAACMERFFLLRCHSSLDALRSLQGLDGLLASAGARAGTPVRVLLVDNVAAHYWVDRAQRPGHAGPPPLSLAKVHAAAAGAVSRASLSRAVLVIATKTPIHRDDGGGGGGGRVHREFLPQAWSEVVTHRVALLAPERNDGAEPVFSAVWEGGSRASSGVHRFNITPTSLVACR